MERLPYPRTLTPPRVELTCRNARVAHATYDKYAAPIARVAAASVGFVGICPFYSDDCFTSLSDQLVRVATHDLCGHDATEPAPRGGLPTNATANGGRV